jgi:AAA domain
VLRDIEASHGAVWLSELHRFTDPAEAAATLALRDGRPQALGFYLDRQRIHVGDPTTTLDSVFNAWQTDHSHGLDPIMLAPTRELVSILNQRARDQRLAGTAPGRQVELADGNAASVGDLIITRSNDRRLRISATDWVKNGDRWTILNMHRAGGLAVRHVWNGRTVTLPAAYVQTSVELGYASTVHTAQGVTADTMHGVVTGEESRQQLYTMLTRGRTGNHIYLSVVGDGDPHAVIQPVSLHPRTATELLEQILARDATPQSATTLQPALQQSPSRDRRLIPARTGGKVEQPHPGRLRRRPACAVGGRRGTPTRRPPCGGPLVAHPRSAPADVEPGPRNPRRCPSDWADGDDATPPAATQAALGSATRVRPEPLKPRRPTHHDAEDVFRWFVAETA